MTHTYNPEYEFDPTLTTMELRAREIEAEEAQREEARRQEALAREEAQREADIAYTLDYEKKICALFASFLANPTIENGSALVSSVDFFSDIYKDAFGVRPHYHWDAYFAQFTSAHHAMWEASEKALYER